MISTISLAVSSVTMQDKVDKRQQSPLTPRKLSLTLANRDHVSGSRPLRRIILIATWTAASASVLACAKAVSITTKANGHYAVLISFAYHFGRAIPCAWDREIWQQSSQLSVYGIASSRLYTIALDACINLIRFFCLGSLCVLDVDGILVLLPAVILAIPANYHDFPRPAPLYAAAVACCLISASAPLLNQPLIGWALLIACAASFAREQGPASQHSVTESRLSHALAAVITLGFCSTNDTARVLAVLNSIRLLGLVAGLVLASCIRQLCAERLHSGSLHAGLRIPLATTVALSASLPLFSQSLPTLGLVTHAAASIAWMLTPKSAELAAQDRVVASKSLKLAALAAVIAFPMYLLSTPQQDPYFSATAPSSTTQRAQRHVSASKELLRARSDVDTSLTGLDFHVRGLHPISTGNIGEWVSSPFHYFAQLNATGFSSIEDIKSNLTADLPPADLAIVGGGSLFRQAPALDAYMQQLALESAHSDVSSVIWGAGFGDIFDPWPADVPAGYYYPNTTYINQFSLLGLRDKIPGFRWVPCASAMFEGFDKVYPSQRPIGYYRDADADPPLTGISISSSNSLSVRSMDLQKTIEFLGTSEVVITNSYHGVYWATLLGRKVIALDRFSRAFDYFAWPPSFYTGDLAKDLSRTRSYPHALTQARAANLAFYKDVRNLIQEHARSVS